MDFLALLAIALVVCEENVLEACLPEARRVFISAGPYTSIPISFFKEILTHSVHSTVHTHIVGKERLNALPPELPNTPIRRLRLAYGFHPSCINCPRRIYWVSWYSHTGYIILASNIQWVEHLA